MRQSYIMGSKAIIKGDISILTIQCCQLDEFAKFQNITAFQNGKLLESLVRKVGQFQFY